MGVVLDAELVGHREQQRVGRLDRRVLGQLRDEDIGLRGIRAAEDRLRLGIEVADLVRVLVAPSEVGAVAIVDQGKDAPADRNSRLARDVAVQAADTVLLTVPNQLGVEYNARLLETIAREIAPAIGWQPATERAPA